jgi:hypothetical protein
MYHVDMIKRSEMTNEEYEKICDKIVMKYSLYKNFYMDYKTIEGSYNKQTKEITVLFPKNNEVYKSEDINYSNIDDSLFEGL